METEATFMGSETSCCVDDGGLTSPSGRLRCRLANQENMSSGFLSLKGSALAQPLGFSFNVVVSPSSSPLLCSWWRNSYFSASLAAGYCSRRKARALCVRPSICSPASPSGLDGRGSMPRSSLASCTASNTFCQRAEGSRETARKPSSEVSS